MAVFLQWMAAFLVLMVALGLVRVALGPGRAERMMAAQLLGSGAIGALLLFSAASAEPAVVDVALTLALLAAFASIAFVKFALRQDQAGPSGQGDDGSAALRPSMLAQASMEPRPSFPSGDRPAYPPGEGLS